jgi:hypothetical protein
VVVYSEEPSGRVVDSSLCFFAVLSGTGFINSMAMAKTHAAAITAGRATSHHLAAKVA